jgi:CMP/dCMP kinase
LTRDALDLNNGEKLQRAGVGVALRILLSGLSGTGSTTAAKRIAGDLGLRYVYGGQIFRNLADERNVALEELAESFEKDPEIEHEIDQRLIVEGMNDNVLIESRTLGWLFPTDVPALRIWLTCNLEERLNRVERRENHSRSRENLLRREASDNRRYFRLYGIEPEDFSPFDLVFDTTALSVEQVVEKIEAFVQERVSNSEPVTT